MMPATTTEEEVQGGSEKVKMKTSILNDTLETLLPRTVTHTARYPGGQCLNDKELQCAFGSVRLAPHIGPLKKKPMPCAWNAISYRPVSIRWRQSKSSTSNCLPISPGLEIGRAHV